MKPRISFLLVASLLAGCTVAVGPNYHPPTLAVPAHWSEAPRGGVTDTATDVVEWWKTFKDPQLDSLIERAVAANHDLRMATARLREARAQRGFASWDLAPTVDAQGSFRENRLSKNAQTFQGLKLDTRTYDAGFDAGWEIDLFGGKRRAREAATAEVAASEEDRRDVLVSLLAEVARNYVELRSFQHRLVIVHNNIQSQQASLELVNSRFQGGLTSELDVTQATALLAGTQSQLPLLESSVKQTMHRLGVLLAQEPGALVTELSLEAAIPSTPPKVPVGLPSDLLRRRPDVHRAERQLAATTARIGVETAELFPKFSLVGAGGLKSLTASDWFSGGSRYWSVGPTLSWRILDFGRIHSRIQAANAREEQAIAAYEKTVLLSFEDVEDALVAYANEQVRFKSLREQVTAYQHALDLANQRYTSGVADFLNVLDAQRSLYQAEDNLVQSERAVTTNLIALYKALGGGWNL